MPVAKSVSLSFTSERFDYRSELPSDYNAGNRFYGKDVAEFLVEHFKGEGIDAVFLDEDWGWLVLSARNASPGFEIAVYNLTDHGEGGRPGAPEWGLWIRAYERRKLLGLLPKKTEIQVPSGLLASVHRAIGTTGARAEAWTNGPQ